MDKNQQVIQCSLSANVSEMLVYYNWSNVVKSLKSYSFIVMTVFEAMFVWYLIYMDYGWTKL